MRVYIPVTLAMVRQLVSDGSLRPVSGTAFAVTPKLREAYAEGDGDEVAARVAAQDLDGVPAAGFPEDRGDGNA